MDAPVDERAETIVRDLAEKWTRSGPGECLICYLCRMLEEFGCDGSLRFTAAFRDERMPRARALEHRLARAGGYCDCEVTYNAVRAVGPAPDGVPECRQVRTGTTRPCALWRCRGW